MPKIKLSICSWVLIFFLSLSVGLLWRNLIVGSGICVLEFNFIDIGGCILNLDDIVIVVDVGFLAYMLVSSVLTWRFELEWKFGLIALRVVSIFVSLAIIYLLGGYTIETYENSVGWLRQHLDHVRCDLAIREFNHDIITIKSFQAMPIFDQSSSTIEAFDMKFSLTGNFATTLFVSPELRDYKGGVDFVYFGPSMNVQISPEKESTVTVRVTPRTYHSLSNLPEYSISYSQPEALYGQIDIEWLPNSADSQYNFENKMIFPYNNFPENAQCENDPGAQNEYYISRYVINDKLIISAFSPSQFPSESPAVMPLIPTTNIVYTPLQ